MTTYTVESANDFFGPGKESVTVNSRDEAENIYARRLVEALSAYEHFTFHIRMVERDERGHTIIKFSLPETRAHELDSARHKFLSEGGVIYA